MGQAWFDGGAGASHPARRLRKFDRRESSHINCPCVGAALRHEGDVDGVFAGDLAGEQLEGAFSVGEGEGVGMHSLEGIFAGLDEPDCFLVVRVVDAEGTVDGELFHDDSVAEEVRDGIAEALGAGEDDATASTGEVDRLGDGLGSVGGDVDDDVGAGGRSWLRGRQVRTSSRSATIVKSAPNSRARASFGASFSRPVTMMRPAPASLAASTLPRPRWPGPRMTIVSPGWRRGISTAQRNPAPIGLKSVAMAGSIDSSIVWTTDVGREIEVLAVSAPEAGRVVEADEAVGGDAAAPARAEVWRATTTLVALAAGREGLDADTVALLDAPAAGGLVADLGDAAHGLVAGDSRIADGQRAPRTARSRSRRCRRPRPGGGRRRRRSPGGGPRAARGCGGRSGR